MSFPVTLEPEELAQCPHSTEMGEEIEKTLMQYLRFHRPMSGLAKKHVAPVAAATRRPRLPMG